MENIAFLLPALGCVVMMPVMMWMMNRGSQHRGQPDGKPSGRESEVAQLRREVEQLRAEQGDQVPDRDRH